MINKGGNKELTSRYRLLATGKWRSVQEVYRGARLVWMAVRSCFGSGGWINEKPWVNEEGWSNE